jgi:hypothetical protein
MAQRTLGANEMAEFYDMARHRRAYFESAGCRYWVFEQRTAPGTIVEFAEGPDPETLAAALRSHPTTTFDGPIFAEVETR